MATDATLTPDPSSSATATCDHVGVNTDGSGTRGLRPSGSGSIALRARLRTLPGVSAPSSVVRSTMEIARSIAASLEPS